MSDTPRSPLIQREICGKINEVYHVPPAIKWARVALT
jgi:hypothetical protein